jgi:hypothetical protein
VSPPRSTATPQVKVEWTARKPAPRCGDSVFQTLSLPQRPLRE